jgi:hypothetical protein
MSIVRMVTRSRLVGDAVERERVSRVGVSARTWAVLAASVAISGLTVIALRFVSAGALRAWVSSAPDILISLMATAVIVWSRRRMGRDAPLRASWLAFGIGCALFCAGEIVFAAGVASVLVGASDLFFLASFPFVTTGLGLAFFAFRRGHDWLVPLVGGFLLGAFLAVELYVGVLYKVAQNPDLPLVERAVGLFYPFADVLLVLPWILGLIFLLVGVRNEPLSWPWWTVALGVLVGVASDTSFAVLSANGSYAPGGIADMGWWIAYTCMALAASLTIDIRDTAAEPHPAASQSATI